MKKTLLLTLMLFGFAVVSYSQTFDPNDRDKSKYAVNNFADDDKYFMYEPYETVSVSEPKGRKVKNVIYMIGDGMGLEQLSAAWVCNGGKLNIDNFNVTGLIRSYSANRLVTDSAAAGTALATGNKTNNGMVGVTPDGTSVESLAEYAKSKGKKVGTAVTCRINDATPAAFFAHSESRNNQEEIVAQFAESGIDFLSGGGIMYWQNRKDGRDLVQEVKDKGYSFAATKDELMAVEEGPVIALMAPQELPYALDRGDVLPSAVTKALQLLDNRKGFSL